MADFKKFKIVGHSIERADAWEKAEGRTSYADDYIMPGILYAKVLRGSLPSAKILEINKKAAERLPGVRAILTAEDVPKNEFIIRYGQMKLPEEMAGLHRVLARDKTRYTGEPVALVAAETEEIAIKAIELIQVKYEKTPGVFDPLEAMKPEAPLVGEGTSNIITHYEVTRGNLAQGFEEADVVIENTYRVPFVDHAYIEPEAGLAWVDETGVINIRVCTQIIEHYKMVAEVLNLPHNRVRVMGTMVGGGFGGKEDISVETFLALLALKTKKPVKLTYTREESIMCHPKRHPYVMHYKTGAKKDGKITALEVNLVADAGAYPYLSPLVLLYSTVDAAGPYNIPNVHINSYSVLTNNCISSANRGFGAPQVCFAYESQMDELASKLRMEPLKIREINYLKRGEKLPTGQEITNYIALPETAIKALEALGEPTSPSKNSCRIGRGIASGMTSYGRTVFHHDTARCYMSLEMDGSVIIRTGTQDVGAGQSSTYCQITSEILGIPMDDIRIHIADTALTPQAGTTTASRATYMVGNATLLAAQELRKILLKKAAEILEIAVEDLNLENKEVIIKGFPEKKLTLQEVIRECSDEGLPLYSIGLFKAPFRELKKKELGQVFPDFTFGSHAVEVEVDTETGKVNVLKIAACFDVGRAINPQSVEGQIEGGTIYGLGYALTEEVLIEGGIIKNLSLSKYLVPTSTDIPELITILIESGEGLGPFGAKGIGEPPVASVAPAVANAIFNAVGLRIVSLPITPEKIFLEIRKNLIK